MSVQPQNRQTFNIKVSHNFLTFFLTNPMPPYFSVHFFFSKPLLPIMGVYVLWL
jgi:hypothetical protein